MANSMISRRSFCGFLPLGLTPLSVAKSSDNNNNYILIHEAFLPDGGFVAVYRSNGYIEGQLTQSVVEVTGYLRPGTHKNIKIELGRGSGGQNYTAILYKDTNENRNFDYIKSGRETDTPYILNSDPVFDSTFGANELPSSNGGNGRCGNYMYENVNSSEEKDPHIAISLSNCKSGDGLSDDNNCGCSTESQGDRIPVLVILRKLLRFLMGDL